jgi:hypothetical protein
LVFLQGEPRSLRQGSASADARQELPGALPPVNHARRQSHRADRPQNPALGRRRRRAPRPGAASRSPGEPGATKTSGAAASTPLATLDALLALQGERDPAERRRRTVKRGHDLLDGLDRLKAALLSNRVPTADLLRLAAQLAENADLSGDPRLDELVSHIELRAKVELAKLGVA